MENSAWVRGTYIIPVVGSTYTNRNGNDCICTEVFMFGEARLERIKDGWTLYAHGVQQYEDGTIEGITPPAGIGRGLRIDEQPDLPGQRGERELTMKFTVKKGDASSIRKVWSDDKEVCYGIVGTVGDLLAAKILTYCDYKGDGWAFLPSPGIMQKAWFGSTREAACAKIPA